MLNEDELLEFSKNLVQDAALEFSSYAKNDHSKKHKQDNILKREIKSTSDVFLEDYIISKLEKTGIPILSEEIGFIGNMQDSDYLFIVDPLDGTFNFVRNFGSYAISVALWHMNKPVFGVIYDLDKNKFYWGGKATGSFCNNIQINVSNISDISKSLVCSGFPVRYDFTQLYQDKYLEMLSHFSKIRMIGSAAISIVQVSRGVADAYFEKNIMIWDVAAGLAIAEGAGGSYLLLDTSIEKSFDVIVGNPKLLKKIEAILKTNK